VSSNLGRPAVGGLEGQGVQTEVPRCEGELAGLARGEHRSGFFSASDCARLRLRMEGGGFEVGD
jgi:hypothetical protein